MLILPCMVKGFCFILYQLGKKKKRCFLFPCSSTGIKLQVLTQFLKPLRAAVHLSHCKSFSAALFNILRVGNLIPAWCNWKRILFQMQTLPQFLTSPARVVCKRDLFIKCIYDQKITVHMLSSFFRDPQCVFQNTSAFRSAKINGDDFLLLSPI